MPLTFPISSHLSVRRNHEITELLALNQDTEKFNLTLSATDAKMLVLTKDEALEKHRRIEFGDSIISRMIAAFSNSPYIHQGNYAEILHDLIEIFYYFKSESCDALDDDSLVAIMKTYFNEICEGSLELLSIKDLEAMVRKLRKGEPDYQTVRDPHNWYEWEEWNE